MFPDNKLYYGTREYVNVREVDSFGKEWSLENKHLFLVHPIWNGTHGGGGGGGGKKF
jgi:hypothetical protein